MHCQSSRVNFHNIREIFEALPKFKIVFFLSWIYGILKKIKKKIRFKKLSSHVLFFVFLTPTLGSALPPHTPAPGATIGHFWLSWSSPRSLVSAISLGAVLAASLGSVLTIFWRHFSFNQSKYWYKMTFIPYQHSEKSSKNKFNVNHVILCTKIFLYQEKHNKDILQKMVQKLSNSSVPLYIMVWFGFQIGNNFLAFCLWYLLRFPSYVKYLLSRLFLISNRDKGLSKITSFLKPMTNLEK